MPSFRQAVEVLLAPYNLSHPDAVVDTADADGLEARLERAWPTVRPGGAFFFLLQAASVPVVQAWAFALTHRMSVYASHQQRGYMGKPTPFQKAAVAAASRHPLPSLASFLFCARSGCALSKVGPCDCQPQAGPGGGMLAACAAAVARPEVRACASASRRAAETVGLVRAGSVALPVSDKIDTSGYQIMYGALLRHRRGGGGSGGGGAGGGRALRLFEVGLGCDQRYGPGARDASYSPSHSSSSGPR